MAAEKKQEETFEEIGDDKFQELIIEALIHDKEYAENMLEVLQPEYFTYSYMRYIVAKMFKYYERYRCWPSIPILINILKDALEDENDKTLIKKIVEFFKSIRSNPSFGDLPYVMEKSLIFCKDRAVKSALEKSIDLAQAGSYGSIPDLLKKAMSLGEGGSIGIDMHSDETRFEKVESLDPIPTGIEFIDHKEVFGGGVERGTIAVMAMASGFGKSQWLVHCTGHAVTLGYNVIYYSLEMSEKKVGHRLDAWVSGVNSREIVERKEEVESALNKWREENNLGKLIVKKFPSGQATANTVRAHLNKIKASKGFTPDLVVIDYFDEAKSIESHASDSRHKYPAIYRDFRNLAEEFEVAIWSASQVNGDGFNNAESMNQSHMGESKAKTNILDYLLMAGTKPEYKKTGMRAVSVSKVRDGGDGGTGYIHIDTRTSRIRQVSKDEYLEAVKSPEEHENDMKKKLKSRLKMDLDDLGSQKA